MVYRGTFKKGVVVLDDKVEMAEGQRVTVEPALSQPAPPSIDPALQNRELLKIAGIVSTGRRDGSVNHDHYMYGSAKRKASE